MPAQLPKSRQETEDNPVRRQSPGAKIIQQTESSSNSFDEPGSCTLEEDKASVTHAPLLENLKLHQDSS